MEMDKIKTVSHAVSKSLVFALAFLLLASFVQATAVRNIYLDDYPAQATYTIKTDGTNVWAVKYDGDVLYESTNASYVMNSAISVCGDYRSVYVSSGNYTLTAPVVILDKSRFTFICDGVLKSPNSNYALEVIGTSYVNSWMNVIKVKLIDGQARNGHGILIRNSFATKVYDSELWYVNKGVVISNTVDWSEGTILNNVQWYDCILGVSFEVSGTGTASFVFMDWQKVLFNLFQDGAIGIKFLGISGALEAQYTCGVFNPTIWFHNNNQKGFIVNGSCTGMTILNPYIESSQAYTSIVGILYGQNKTGRDTIISPKFVDNWTGAGAHKIDFEEAGDRYTCILPPNTYEPVVSVGATSVSFNHSCLIQPFQSGVSVATFSTSATWNTTWTISSLNSTGISLVFGTVAPANAKCAVTIRVDAWEKQTG